MPEQIGLPRFMDVGKEHEIPGSETNSHRTRELGWIRPPHAVGCVIVQEPCLYKI